MRGESTTLHSAGRCKPYSTGDSLAEKRVGEAARIKEKYPDRIPVSPNARPVTLTDRVNSAISAQVIVERVENSKSIHDIDKKK